MSFRIHSQRASRVARRLSARLAVVIAVVALAVPAAAARIKDVRVGLHQSFTRVVFETDTPAKYRVERSPSGEIIVVLDATSTPRRVTTRSQFLREVRVEPGTSATKARLTLRAGDVKINELILLNPPRIVLDLRGTTKATTSASKTTPAPQAKPAPAATTVAKTTPKVVEPAQPQTTAQAKPSPSLAEQARAATSKTTGELLQKATEAAQEASASTSATTEVAEAAETASKTGAGVARKLTALPHGEEAGEKAPQEAASALDAARIKGAELAEKSAELAKSATGDLAPSATPPAAAQPPAPGGTQIARRVEPPARVPSPARKPSETPTERATPSPAEEASGLPAFLKDPVVLGGIGLAIVLALGIFVHHRRGGREDDFLSPVSDDEPFSIDEGAQARAETDETTQPETEASAPADPSAHAPAFDVTETAGGEESETSREDEEAAAVNTGMDTPTETGFSPMPPAVGANADVMRMMQELERRVTVLEKRLEETAEAKERLERQVAAQTEELRVQRSAIARTQRALRSIARPEDEATEPVPKT